MLIMRIIVFFQFKTIDGWCLHRERRIEKMSRRRFNFNA